MKKIFSKLILVKPSLPRLRRGTLSQKGESNKVILAIETSCDETAAAVLLLEGQPTVLPPISASLDGNPVFPPTRPAKRGSSFSLTMPQSLAKPDAFGTFNFPKITTLSSVVKSQIKLHSKMGGVVPEAAARAHVKYIRPVVEQALQATSYKLQAIDYIAVTAGPGLIPSLIVGVEFAKGLAFAAKKPIIPVNHMLGHLYSPFNNFHPSPSPLPRGRGQGEGVFPIISLIVSGGHTILVLQKDIKNYKVLGQTVDDAAGEAFDKVAKLLGLPYPGGPEVSKLAKKGKPDAINFPRPMIHSKDYNFSFAGLKTAVLYYVESLPKSEILNLKSDICSSFQQAAVDVLVTKTLRAAKEFKARSISLSGGVSANKLLRETLKKSCDENQLRFFAPPLHLTTDNAEMIGLAAGFMLHNGFKPKSYRQIKPNSNLSL